MVRPLLDAEYLTAKTETAKDMAIVIMEGE